MKTMRLLTLAAIISVPAFCDHPDLSGLWQLDVTASYFGTAPIPHSGYLTISTGSHKTINMEVSLRNLNNGQLERSVQSEWKVDNKFHPVIGGQAGEVLAKWDGSVLLGERLTDTGMEDIRFVPGPYPASMVETIQSPQGMQTLVWHRQ